MKKIIKLNKTMMCLIINVILSAQINMLIDEKLLFQSKLKHCELYHKNCYFIQYFKCQKYEHTIQICYQNQKCDFYITSKHNDHNYVFQNKLNKHCCTNCKKLHSAWSSKCKIRQKQIEKAQLVYTIRSCRYTDAFIISMRLNSESHF